MSYACYLGGMEVPTPAKLTVKVKGKNKTLVLLNEGEINFLRSTPADYLDMLKDLKANKKTTQFILARSSPDGRRLYDTNMTVSVEDYSIVEDAKKGLDVSVDVNLKQWRDYGTIYGLSGAGVDVAMKCELMIQQDENVMLPPFVEGVTIEWKRAGQPGKLMADVVKTPGLSFQEGAQCCFFADGAPVFYGFVFDKARKGGSSDVISVTAYDQLYYLKNKDTCVYENKTAADVVRMIADDFELKTGSLEDTGFIIASRVEDNKTLFDIIQTALDETLKATGRMFVLYDEAGKLALKGLESMKINLLINAATAGEYDYKTSISAQTYDKIKLSYENKKTGKRETYVAKDSSNIYGPFGTERGRKGDTAAL